MSKKDRLQSKNKLKCKLYYNKNKNELKTLKELNTELKNEIQELKIKLSIYSDIYDDDSNDDSNDDNDDDSNDDNDDDSNDDNDDIEPYQNKSYEELYNEIALKTKHFNLVFIKDFERTINSNLLKYQNLFLDNLNDKALDNKRLDWFKNMNKYLNGGNNEYETVYYQYQML